MQTLFEISDLVELVKQHLESDSSHTLSKVAGTKFNIVPFYESRSEGWNSRGDEIYSNHFTGIKVCEVKPEGDRNAKNKFSV